METIESAMAAMWNTATKPIPETIAMGQTVGDMFNAAIKQEKAFRAITTPQGLAAMFPGLVKVT